MDALKDALLTPMKLEPGGVYVLQSDRPMGERTREAIRTQLAVFAEQTGCRFLVLDCGISLKCHEPEASSIA